MTASTEGRRPSVHTFRIKEKAAQTRVCCQPKAEAAMLSCASQSLRLEDELAMAAVQF